MLKKELKPPFKPHTSEGNMDTSNFDDEFKQEAPHDTPVVPSSLARNSKITFPDFTYTEDAGYLGQSHMS